MGRKKIKIRRIEDPALRSLTFNRRKVGLTKKAMELSILCDADVALLVFGESGDLYLYSSKPFEEVMNKFSEYDGEMLVLKNSDHPKMISGIASSFTVGKIQSKCRIEPLYPNVLKQQSDRSDLKSDHFPPPTMVTLNGVVNLPPPSAAPAAASAYSFSSTVLPTVVPFGNHNLNSNLRILESDNSDGSTRRSNQTNDIKRSDSFRSKSSMHHRRPNYRRDQFLMDHSESIVRNHSRNAEKRRYHPSFEIGRRPKFRKRNSSSHLTSQSIQQKFSPKKDDSSKENIIDGDISSSSNSPVEIDMPTKYANSLPYPNPNRSHPAANRYLFGGRAFHLYEWNPFMPLPQAAAGMPYGNPFYPGFTPDASNLAPKPSFSLAQSEALFNSGMGTKNPMFNGNRPGDPTPHLQSGMHPMFSGQYGQYGSCLSAFPTIPPSTSGVMKTEASTSSAVKSDSQSSSSQENVSVPPILIPPNPDTLTDSDENLSPIRSTTPIVSSSTVSRERSTTPFEHAHEHYPLGEPNRPFL